MICLVSFSGADNYALRIPVKCGNAYEYAFATFGTGESLDALPVNEDEIGKYISLDLPRMSGIIIKKSKD